MVFTIRAFVTFFTIIDPVGLAPVIIGLTAHLNDAQRSTVVTRAIVISAIIIARAFSWQPWLYSSSSTASRCSPISNKRHFAPPVPTFNQKSSFVSLI
jgi:MarC family integral membrane protein